MGYRFRRNPVNRKALKKGLFRPGQYACCALLGLLFSSSAMTEIRFTSPKQQVQLIELYTSEGCSSCPPADQWLSRLRDNPALWQQFIPLSFHVDYWDYIGWPDRFADKRFSQRQRQHQSQGNIRQVYTPGFVVNGKEWRGWYTHRSLPENKAEPGQLQLIINGSAFNAGFSGQSNASRLTIVLLGAGLSTSIKAGENKGALLQHDFVVLALADYDINGGGSWQGQLPSVAERYSPDKMAVAAWLSPSGSLVPVQAVGGWLH